MRKALSHSAQHRGAAAQETPMARQQNVQQQNRQALERMLQTARNVRRTGLPPGAVHFLAERGIEAASCAVVFIETAGDILSLEHGIHAFLVTPDNRIFEMELELDATLDEVLQVLEFQDVTDAQNLSKHNPGWGWGWGALALVAGRKLRDADPPAGA